MERNMIIILIWTLNIVVAMGTTPGIDISSIPKIQKRGVGKGSSTSPAAPVDPCGAPLGMESEKIPPSRISASSSFDVKSTGPQNARIRKELVAGAWCPLSTIQEGVKEYLEIDLEGDHRITKTETQGRFGNGMGQEFAKNFQLEYWRESLGKWIPYKDNSGRSILEGNTNTYIGVEQKLEPPIIGSKIRFIPHSVHPMTVCMRVEAYGCPYTDGLIHYDVAQGYWKNNPEVDLRDLTYDGWMDENEILRGGLGILTDSLLGPADFKAERKTQGNRWIGWDNELQPVKIGFQFDGIRKFSSVSVHVNNLVSEGVEVFASVDVYVSVDGQKFSEFPLRWIPRRDLEKEKVHLLTFPLRGRLASLIRMEFFHSNHWLLISEVSFTSELYTGNVTDEILSLNYLQDGPEEAHPKDTLNVRSAENEDGSDIGVVGLVIGSVGLFILCCLLLVSCIVLKRSRGKLVGDMGLGLRPKSLDERSAADGNEFSNKAPVKDFLWTSGYTNNGEGERGESFYNELVFRGFNNGYEGSSFSNPSSSSNSTSSSNLTRSTTIGPPSTTSGGKTGNTCRKIKYQRVEPLFTEYLSMDGGMRYFGQTTSRSQPGTPKTERGNLHFKEDSVLPPPPPPKFNRPLPTHFTFTNKLPLFTTPASVPHPHSIRTNTQSYQSPSGRNNGRSTNYYAATDLLRRENSSGNSAATAHVQQRF